ncbi:MAG: SDR family NAD(P)-dependent oxidoreductase [Deltaproteobacteria bacterium]|nr:SDR family NAD(P)-dependent oxidoreductase [Deltaproteobacteria bacterium]
MKVNLKPLKHQVIVITGATSGIGLVTSRMAARKGARLFLTARDEAGLRMLCEEINSDGGEADYHPCDVGKFDELKSYRRFILLRRLLELFYMRLSTR